MTTPPRPRTLRKLAALGALLAAWVAGDLVTKHWADTSLADPFHPLPVTVAPEDDGKPVRAVVAAALGLEEGPALEQALVELVRLPPPKALTPDTRLYDLAGPAGAARGFYVFWRGPDLPPRRIDKSERRTLLRWLRLASPRADPAALEASADEHLADLTVAAWLETHLRRLDDAEAAQVAATAMHPIEGRLDAVAPGAPARAGDTYLVQWRRVDVSGEWFKLLYAENPGAAFGFLKNLPPRVRDKVFFGLTGVVMLVILGLIVRTEARHWPVLVGLTSVLGGALGNFVDRVRYGYVIDFLDMHLGFMHWPTYNVADVAISVGVGLLLLDMLFNKQSPLAAPPPATATGKA